MNDEMKERLQELSMDMLSSEDDQLQCLGSYMQAGSIFYSYDIIDAVLENVVFPKIKLLMGLLGHNVDDVNIEEATKQFDAAILKHILKKGNIE